MRLSQLTGKEVIDIGDGARVGIIETCDVAFDETSGRVLALLIPAKSGLFTFLSDSRVLSIAWPAIKRIGDDVIIVDVNDTFNRDIFTSNKAQTNGNIGLRHTGR